MGKIPPSFRSATLPLTSLKTQTPPPSQFYQFNKPTTKKGGPKQIQPQKPKPPIFTSPSLSHAKRVFDSYLSNSSPLPLDLRHHNALLQSFSHLSTLQDSFAFLHYMSRKNPTVSPDRSTYHILLIQSCSISPSHLQIVNQTIQVMIDNGCPPDHVTLDLAVRSLCSVGRQDDALQLLRELSVKYSPPDSFTFNFIVKHLCKTRALSTVYSFIEEMGELLGLKPDLVTYTILIDNVCNTKNLREATRLLGVLRLSGMKPDAFIYNAIMKGYCVVSNGSEVLGVYKAMKEEGVEPDLVTYNTLIYGLSKVGRVEEARKFLGVMAEMGHFPDTVTYTSLMNGMCRKGEALGALALLGEMEERGCSPNSCTYNTLLHGLCKGKLLEKGLELYELMKSNGMKLESASYATFVRALCREERIAEAYEVFDYAVTSKSLTDVAAYSTLEGTLKWFAKVKEKLHA
ncbi:hypothetical protein Scep_000174 [Stephania cephalantha]|uniref:Pentatricopeptide repeat-containing protein n=1 Tax=Stephania cephalantha TaxID=152367 RepID=A0AAP0L5M6_9MAGN